MAARARRTDIPRKPAAAGKRSGDGEAPTEPGEKNYITPPGYQRLTTEFDYLHKQKRPEVVAALGDAAAEGDRSENAEYIYRKRQLREIDRRLRYLAKRLEIIAIVDPRDQKRRDRVFFGARVVVEDDAGEEHRYRVVGVDETSAEAGDISWRSPVGRALLGKAEGDSISVRWEVKAQHRRQGAVGERELTIVEISYE